MKDYQSTAWVVWRGVWLFDFSGDFMKNFIQHRDWSSSECAVKGYEYALERYHPWIIQKTVKIGIKTIRSREGFVRSLSDSQSRLQGRTYTE